MYFKSIHIKQYCMLEDLTLNFQAPRTPTAKDNGNVVNVLAGANGTGKTSLFEGIFLSKKHRFSDYELDQINNIYIELELESELEKELSAYIQKRNMEYPLIALNSVLSNVVNIDIAGSLPKLIYIPSHLSFSYKEVQKITKTYHFFNKVESQTLLSNAEYYIKEFILSHERTSHEPDPKKRTQAAVDAFNQHFVQTDLLTRLHDLDPQQFNRPIFKNSHGDKVTIDQLSDGEKQLYGRVVSLMILNPNNSVILIDEPEIALHPAWQQMIMRIYASIGENNQFIVATHSPHIIADTPAENLIFLRKNPATQHIEAIHQKSPPAGVDVNSILREFMGIEVLPREQLELHRQYRKLVENGEENSAQAQEIKQRILQKESMYSEFMQEMTFLQQLREI